MKKFLQKIKYNYDAIFIKFAVLLLVLCVSLLLCLNRLAISFSINGFSQLVNNPLQVYFLDVGQASATFLVLPNGQTMLIDTGTEESSFALVKSLEWILYKNKLADVDILVLTHSDEDHVGGAAAVFQKFDVHSAFRPKLLSHDETALMAEYAFPIIYTNSYNSAIKSLYSEPNCQVDFVDNIHMQVQDKLFIDFYACENTNSSETNYFSPFIVLQFKNKTFMFTGDATAEREEEFLNVIEEKQIEISVDFLQVAHHGSKYSSTKNFLNEISPKYAFVSAGDSIHPSEQVRSRLKEAGTKSIFVTKDVGTIGVGIKDDGNFDILTSSKFVDVPCLVVVFLIAGFVFVFYVDTKLNKRKLRSFVK